MLGELYCSSAYFLLHSMKLISNEISAAHYPFKIYAHAHTHTFPSPAPW